MEKKFYIRTFGCQMNVLDSEKVAGLLVADDWKVVPNMEDADLILYNTCSVREKAAQRVYSHLGKIKKLKKKKSSLIICVMGCVAQQEGENMIKAIPEIDMVIGTRSFHKIPEHVRNIMSGKLSPVVDIEIDDAPHPFEIDKVLHKTSFRAFVTIMEGCNNFCSYCVVPYTRGRERSRPSDKIIEEIKRLVDDGVLEVMLLGQNVNSYKDPSSRRYDFSDLLYEVANIEGIKRVRFTTSHPKDFNEKQLKCMVENEKICNQLHLPAQSGSTKILTAMHRKYSREDYLEKIELIKNASTRISLSSDFIVGFPGEEENDFKETLSLLEIVRYDSIFSFIYSPRPFTEASRMTETLSKEEKISRLQELQALQEKIQLKNNLADIGKIKEVLVDGQGKYPGQLASRTEENKIVHFDGIDSLIGNFVTVEITGASAHTLKGKLIEEN